MTLVLVACQPEPAGTILFIPADDQQRPLLRLDVASGEITPVTHGPIVEMAWSPDGRVIAFTRVDPALDAGRVTLFLLEPATGRETRLASDIGRRVGIAWSPDGESLLYVRHTQNADRDLVIMHMQPPYPTIALTTDGLVYGRATWSPIGDRIAFLSRSPDLSTALEVINTDGTQRRVLHRSNLYKRNPVWSPQTGHIAFVMPEGLHVIAADGTDLRLVFASPFFIVNDVLWSPDGSVLYLDDTAEQADVWAVSLDGSVRSHLPNLDGNLAAFSPDGRYLLTASELCLFDVSLGQQHCLGQTAYSGYRPAWGP